MSLHLNFRTPLPARGSFIFGNTSLFRQAVLFLNRRKSGGNDAQARMFSGDPVRYAGVMKKKPPGTVRCDAHSENIFMRLFSIIFCALLFVATPSFAESSALRVEAQTTASGLRDGGRFVADVTVSNISRRDQVWTHAQCSSFPAGWWAADNPAFHVVVDEAACRYVKKNPLVDEKLTAGSAVRWNLSIQFDAAPEDLKRQTAAFRLGFKPHILLSGPADEETT